MQLRRIIDSPVLPLCSVAGSYETRAGEAINIFPGAASYPLSFLRFVMGQK